MPEPARPHHLPSMSLSRVSRRGLLVGGATAATGVATGMLGAPTGSMLGSARAAAHRRTGQIADPFTIGLASGDPHPDGVVLWTRLAPQPLASDGSGGMPQRPVTVQWQMARDERFREVLREGSTLAHPESGHSVHVEVHGLRPATEYFYRFRAEGEISPVGRTKTAPLPLARLSQFSFAFASCQNYPSGFYNAWANMTSEDLDLVIFLGDYIYEGAAAGNIGRAHSPASEIWSLADYRVRLAQYKSDPDLQAAHAAFPWLVTFDDHEVENNWADDVSQRDNEPDADPAVFLQRRARAFQAYYEHMPLRRPQRPQGPNVQMYRRVRFGNLMDFRVLDTRQHRSDQVGDAHRKEPQRTILGATQRDWLAASLAGQSGRWNVLAQQVFFSQRDFVAGSGTNFSNDAWDGYYTERNAVRDHMAASGVSNPVVLTGDVHASYVSNVKADFTDPDSATVATELVGTSISSGGDGQDQRPGDAVQLQENPHIRFLNRKRGYVRNTVTADAWHAEYRTVDYVSSPGAPAYTKAGFVIENGSPGAQQD